MNTKTSRLRRFHALLDATYMTHAKEGLLAGYGVSSSKELGLGQLDELIDYLQGLKNEKNKKKEEEIRKLRHKCLRIISEIGINTQDWKEVNKFMLNKHVCGYHLYELSTEELDIFIYKLYAIRNKIKQKRKELEALSKLN